MAPARLAVHALAEAVEEHALAVLDAHGLQLGQQAQRGQLLHAMRQQRDAHAEFLHIGRGFIHIAGDAALVQRQRKRQPGDAATHHRDRGLFTRVHSALMFWALISAAQRSASFSTSWPNPSGVPVLGSMP